MWAYKNLNKQPKTLRQRPKRWEAWPTGKTSKVARATWVQCFSSTTMANNAMRPQKMTLFSWRIALQNSAFLYFYVNAVIFDWLFLVPQQPGHPQPHILHRMPKAVTEIGPKDPTEVCEGSTLIWHPIIKLSYQQTLNLKIPLALA